MMMMNLLIFYCCVGTLFNIIKVMGYPYKLKVGDIGTESAVLMWRTTDSNVEEFEVHCTGIQHFMSPQQESQTELYAFTHFVPGTLTHLLMGELKPNVNYSCTVSEQVTMIAQIVGNRISDPFSFMTLYDNPERPRPPVVHLQGDQHYRVDLFPVSSKNGPLLGYKIQFHVVKEETPTGVPILHKNELVPFGESAPTDPSHASKASQPVSFQLSFGNIFVPTYVLTDNSALFATAFKKNIKYSVVMIAFSKSEEQSNNKSINLYSVSEPSEPFVATRGHSKTYESVASPSVMGPSHLALAISIGVIIPLFVLGWVFLIGIYLLCRARRIQLKPFSQSDIIEANNFRKAQLQGHTWYPVGGLPWLDPEYDSRHVNGVYSTPNFQTDSASWSPSKRISNNLIQFSPDRTAHSIINQKGYAVSELPHSKRKNSTPPASSSPGHYESSNGFSPTFVRLHYTTTVDEPTNKLVSMSSGPEVASPTKYYSANSENDVVDQPGVILQQSSSSVFIPRGLSGGLQSLRSRSATISATPLERLWHQLSGDIEESEEEDQAPELEMDMYDIHV